MASNLVPCPINIREQSHRYNTFIRPEEVRRKALELRSLADSHGVEPHKMALKFVSQKIRYAPDQRKWRRPDYWQFPRQTLSLRSGDCEDMSYLLASLLLEMGYRDIRTVYGEVVSFTGRTGHMWVEMGIGGIWYVLESTSGEMFPVRERCSRGYRAYIYIYPEGCEYIEPSTSICRVPSRPPVFETIIGGLFVLGALAGLAALLFGRH